jgi:hypothetical protein
LAGLTEEVLALTKLTRQRPEAVPVSFNRADRGDGDDDDVGLVAEINVTP